MHHLHGGNAGGRVNAHRDTDPVVLYAYRLVGQDRDSNRIAATGQGFVHRVCDNFINEVMESAARRVPDVHPGAFAHGLKAFQHLDVPVFVRRGGTSVIVADRHAKEAFFIFLVIVGQRVDVIGEVDQLIAFLPGIRFGATQQFF